MSATDGDAAREWNLRGVLDLLQRQFKLIAATIVVIVGLAVVATLAITPIYSAATLVLVDPSRKNLLEPALQSVATSSDSARVDSEVEIIRSDGVLMQVIDSAKLISDPEFGVRLGLGEKIKAFLRLDDAAPATGEAALGEALDRLKSRVTVQRRALTYLISIGVKSEDPHKAAGLANAIARTYIAHQIQAKVQSTLTARNVIQEQIAQARNAVVEGETAFSRYIFDNMDQIVAITGRTDLDRMRHDVDVLTNQKKATAERIDSLRGSLGAQDWDLLADTLQTNAAKELERQRAELEQSLGVSKPGSKAALALREELAKVEGSLAAAGNKRLAELQSSLAENDAAAAAARQNLSSTILNSNLPPDILAELYGLQQVARNATSQYQTLLGRLQDLETESSLQVADTRVVSEAIAPIAPSFPNVLLIIILATLAAVGIGVALAFLFENYIGGFTSIDQVVAVTRQRLGTVLPRQARENGSDSVADVLVSAPLSRYSEGMRRLRVLLDTAVRKTDRSTSKDDPLGIVIMVSSALPAEGKTTVALSLARTYALTGQSTIILDCDLRKPSIHKHLGLAPSTGLVDVLRSTSLNRDLSSILVRDGKSPLSAIVGARQSDLPTDQLVAGKSFSQLISAMRKTFDYIIIDSPPLEPVVDGLYLSRYADAIVFVVRWATSPQPVVVNSIERLGSTMHPSANIFVALNWQEASSAAYGGKYSSYYTAQ